MDRQTDRQAGHQTGRQAVVICYDIRSNKARRKVHRVLQSWRLDGQYSLCEARLSEAEATELMLQLAREIDEDTDRLLLARIPRNRPVRVRGNARADSFERSLEHVQ